MHLRARQGLALTQKSTHINGTSWFHPMHLRARQGLALTQISTHINGTSWSHPMHLRARQGLAPTLCAHHHLQWSIPGRPHIITGRPHRVAPTGLTFECGGYRLRLQLLLDDLQDFACLIILAADDEGYELALIETPCGGFRKGVANRLLDATADRLYV